MKLSRRSFLGGTLAATGVLALPAVKLLGDLPIIYGDGFHDDTAGFQAALRGERFSVSREGLAIRQGGTLFLKRGNFLFHDTIRVTERVPVVSVGNIYQWANVRDELECGFDLTDAKGSSFMSDYFERGSKMRWVVNA